MNLDKAVANPYAPPQSSLNAAGTQCYREGKILVVPAGEALPERCVKCNDPATMDKTRTFSWHSSGWYLLILVGVLVYVIAGMIVRKKVRLELGLCNTHRQRRSKLHLAALGLFVLGGLGIFGGINVHEGFGWTGALALLVGLIVALRASAILSPSLIDDTQSRFRGCGNAFLDSLPER